MAIKISCEARDVYLNNSGKNPNVLANASITIDDVFVVKGLTVMNGAKGAFVNMPQKSYKDKEGNTVYKDIAFPNQAGLRDTISNSVLQAYEAKRQQTQTNANTNTNEPTEQEDYGPELS